MSFHLSRNRFRVLDSILDDNNLALASDFISCTDSKQISKLAQQLSPFSPQYINYSEIRMLSIGDV